MANFRSQALERLRGAGTRGFHAPEPPLTVGTPKALFRTRLDPAPQLDQYDVTDDGQRFLFLAPVGDATQTPITVIVNWTAGLRK